MSAYRAPKQERRRPSALQPDPYFEWAKATGFAYYGEARRLPVLLELNDGEGSKGLNAYRFAQQVLEMRARSKHRQGWAADVSIPECELAALTPRSSTRFISLLVREKFLSNLCAGITLLNKVRRFELGRRIVPPGRKPMNSVPVQEPGCWPDAAPQVVTGLIDDGIGFAHDRLFSSDGTTRIEYFWDQQVPSSAWPPDFGTEYTKRAPVIGIDARAAASRHNGIVDEDEVYRLSGQADHTQAGHKPLAAARSHGAHVADLACNPPWPHTTPLPAAAGTRPVVAVQLPSVTVQDTSGATLAPQVYQGLCYILCRSKLIAQRSGADSLPVVVNISYGFISGPHDGSGLLESAIDQLLIDHNSLPGQRAARVVLPAGNNHLSRCHAHFSLPAGSSRELRWRVLPDDRTESSVDMWLPAGTKLGKLSVLITAPDGSNGTGAFPANGQCEFKIGNDIVGRATFFPAGSPALRSRITLWLAPTVSPDGNVPTAMAGVWLIKIRNRHGSVAVNDIHAWVQRDDTAPGYPQRGRQSTFDDPAYQRFDDGGRAVDFDNAASDVRRGGLFNAIASGSEPIVVGGYRRSDGAAATYSAGGPLLPPKRQAPNPEGPEAMLPSDDSPSQRGVLAAGTRSNSCVALSGTSVAVPQAVVGVAEWMALNAPETRNAMFLVAQSHEAMQSFPTAKPTLARGGGGRICTPSNRPPRRELR